VVLEATTEGRRWRVPGTAAAALRAADTVDVVDVVDDDALLWATLRALSVAGSSYRNNTVPVRETSSY